ncbi:Serine/threonine-protein kinase/endoribonuclease IRE1a, partial [Mucuna pruriens]
MKFRVSISLQSLILLFSFFFFFFSSSTSQSQLSLLSLPPSAKPATALVAALDGTMYLVDSVTGRVIWSFSTGSPIYHSHHAPINNPNDNITGLIECGDDWELIVHDTHFGKTRLSESVADYVAFTPTITKEGAVILGSKRNTMFEVNAKTGGLVRSYSVSGIDNASNVVSSDDDSHRVTITKNKELADPAQLNSPEFLLKIFRTDYFLQSVGPTGIVLWTMAVAEFKAVLLCNENPAGRASFDAEDGYVSNSGLDFAMPYSCWDRKLKEVYRYRNNFLLEPAGPERLSGVYQENDILPWRTSELMLPYIDRFVPGQDGHMMLPLPMPNSLPSLQQKIGFYESNDDVAMLPQPLMEITAPEEVDPNREIEWLTTLPLIILFTVFLGFFIFYRSLVVRNKVVLKDQNSELNSKSSPHKKKKARKSGKNSIIVDKQDRHLSSAEGDILTHEEIDIDARLHFNKVDGRRIGKLFVSNNEIAKGSNGTIVLEGTYEGRAVAVKRLVQVHHDVAHKEIQNLIASDRHPNIVRWYGVECDHDFVYLALERCTCNLDDLIHICSDISENPSFSKDQYSHIFKNAQMKTERNNMQYLWKANGFPSPLLLNLMRDVVSGLAHLHELGIIHRDLKPQNVLIIKERSLCAKLSDMGISKRLLEDMSSLHHSTTGCGSSGWQAPEQLVQGRQTRAVDLFSLGCVLFFCMTAGRHPFGERLERDVNIVKNQKDLFLVEFIPEAEDLISCLLNPNPDLRPKAIEVLHHPLFWSSEMRLSFLRDASDRVELEDREIDSDLLKALENIAPLALGAKWDEKLDPDFITNIGRYRRYKFDSVRDLLRVMRNKLNHYRELPQEIQELVGSVPEGFNAYFASRFPRLLIEVYKVICKNCKDDECFQRYFRYIN